MSANRLLIVAMIVGAAVTTAWADHQTQGFGARTDAVLVDVSVSRGGVAVDGLTAADFTVRDSGVPQSVQLVATDSLPVALLLVLDASASVRGAALDHLKEAARAALATLRPQDEAAVLAFSHQLMLRTNWSSSRDAMTKAIDGVTGQGFTAMNDAAFAALAMGGKPGFRRLILFFTDGDDTSSWTSAAEILQSAKRSDAIVYAVTLDAAGQSGAAVARLLEQQPKGSNPARGTIEQWLVAEPTLYRGAALSLLALETGGESLRAADTLRLAATFRTVLSRFNRRYLLAYAPTGVPATGWHPIDVEVKGGGDISARRGYLR